MTFPTKNLSLKTRKSDCASSKSKSSLGGHRKRLRERFLCAGLDGFLDYEVVELLLTLGTPRRDCKQQAKEAIRSFGSLIKVLDAELGDLQKIKGIGPSNAFGLKLFQAVSERYFKEKAERELSLENPEAIFSYLKEKIGREKKEYFIILYLDTKNKLFVENISIGTLNASIVHPREVFSRAITNGVARLIIAHNHPSGDVRPSDDDKKTTERLVEAGKLLGITVLDHIIISRKEYFSFRENGLIF